jgi:glycosyltransferase involved in cell wall biosynthesis
MVTPSGPYNHGGVERHVREVSSRLVAMGHSVSVLCSDSDHLWLGTQVIDGVPVTTVPAWPRGRDWRFAPGIWLHTRKSGADLVHVQSYHTFVAPIAMAAAASQGTPYVVTFHGGGHSESWRNRIRVAHRLALRPLLARAARLIAVAQFEIDEYGRELRLPADRFALLPNGTEVLVPDHADGAGASLGGESGHDRLVLATIGRLEQYKGHHRVIAAMPDLLKTHPNASLVVVGTGPYERDLRAQTRRLGLDDQVEFTSVPAGDAVGMARLLRRVSLVVLMSEFETHPLAALEAAAAHRRLLVADRAGLLAIAQTGLARAIRLESSPQQLAEAISEELDKPAPYAPVELPTWDDCAAALEGLYQEVMCPSGRP